MIEHPLLNFKDLGDEDLITKASDIHAKLSKAHMWGSSQEIIDQFSWMLEMIEEEQRERAARQNFQALQSMFPEVVESDPHFNKERVEEPDTTARVVKPAAKKFQDLPEPSFNKEYSEPQTKGSRDKG